MTLIPWQEILPQIRRTFRNSFVYPHKKVTQWFPGHMNRGMKQMEAKFKSVDCVIEVHDARIPITGRNPKLAHSFLAAKPYILVLNKADLIPPEYKPFIMSTLKERENIVNVIFTNAKKDTCPGLRSIVKKAATLISQSPRYNRSEAEDYSLMVIGVPNVGKSSLINALRGIHLRKKSALYVAPEAGATKSVHERLKVCNNPPVFLFDTPGIMNPSINTMDTGMRLASCATFKDHLVGETTVADYLLYRLNKNEEFGYVSALDLSAPSDDINQILLQIAIQKNLKLRIRDSEGTYKVVPDFKSAAQHFINQFRLAKFGTIVLDKDLLDVTDINKVSYANSLNT